MRQQRLSYYEDEHGPLIVGTAQPASDADEDTEYPVAMLWLPDPTQRSGWCDRWVKRQRQDVVRKCGFGR